MTSFAFTALTVAAGNLIKTRCCFKEGTLVETENGLKPIEEIEVGDKVLAYDETTGEQAYKPVVRLFRNTTNEWYHIHAGGEEIICTGGHPFYVASLDKFIPARELKVGSTLLLSDGSCVIIEAVEVEKLSTPQTTYNLEVADFHTYYVSDSKILVHNDCKAKALKEDTSISRDIQGEGKYGSYDITYSDGTHYIGKGGQERMWQSAAQHSSQTRSVTSVKWSSAANSKEAFIQEALRMQAASSQKIILLNKIASPGFKYLGIRWYK